MKIDSKVISRNVEENVSRRAKNIRKKNKRSYLSESVNTFFPRSSSHVIVHWQLLHYDFQIVSMLSHLITGAPSSLLLYSAYRDKRKRTIEDFSADSPKYVALKDLFLSQDEDTTSTLINCEQPYESFYDFGLTTDYR